MAKVDLGNTAVRTLFDKLRDIELKNYSPLSASTGLPKAALID